MDSDLSEVFALKMMWWLLFMRRNGLYVAFNKVELRTSSSNDRMSLKGLPLLASQPRCFVKIDHFHTMVHRSDAHVADGCCHITGTRRSIVRT